VLFIEYTYNQFCPNAKILDIGCGDGTIWLNNQNKISNNISITLADISLKMLEECQNNTQHLPQIKTIEEADCYYLPYLDKSFDNLEPLYKKKKQLYEYMQKYLNKNNLFYLTTHAGMFVARKRKK